MVDFFLAIDQHEKKKRLLSGFVPNQRVASAHTAAPEESDSDAGSDEERIAAIGGDKWDRKNRWKKNGSKPPEKEKPVEASSKPIPTPQLGASSENEKRLMAMMEEMKGLLDYQKRPKLDRATVKCFRCQETGHFAAECTAEKPVWRERKREETGN